MSIKLAPLSAKQGRELQGSLRYGLGQTPFGAALVAEHALGICALAFVDAEPSPQLALADCQARFPQLHAFRDDHWAQALLQSSLRAKPVALTLAPVATPFQQHVWSALLSIEHGQTCTYQQLAHLIAQPKAARAVGSALAANGIAYLLPCHRVLPAAGGCGQYRWGTPRKQAMLAWEAQS